MKKIALILLVFCGAALAADSAPTVTQSGNIATVTITIDITGLKSDYANNIINGVPTTQAKSMFDIAILAKAIANITAAQQSYGKSSSDIDAALAAKISCDQATAAASKATIPTVSTDPTK